MRPSKESVGDELNTHRSMSKNKPNLHRSQLIVHSKPFLHTDSHLEDVQNEETRISLPRRVSPHLSCLFGFSSLATIRPSMCVRLSRTGELPSGQVTFCRRFSLNLRSSSANRFSSSISSNSCWDRTGAVWLCRRCIHPTNGTKGENVTTSKGKTRVQNHVVPIHLETIAITPNHS